MGFRVRILPADGSPDDLPDPAGAGIALGYPEGLVAVGGSLEPDWLLHAYRRGIFPWFNEDQPILWWSPDPRAVIVPQRFHMSRSLARSMRSGRWSYSLNQCCAEVIQGCAVNRGRAGTWLIPAMQDAYLRLHDLGYVHSVESWLDGELAGGIYGLRLGAVFFGESMFSNKPEGSKVALSGLVDTCLQSGIRLIDCQLESAHLHSLGAESWPRQRFLAMLDSLTAGAGPLADWQISPRNATAPALLRRQAPRNESGQLA